MININDLFNSVLDITNETSNGQLSYDRFNRYSWLAQLRMLDWLSGDVANILPPTPYLAEKNRAWLSPFIVKYPSQVTNAIIEKPSDYYVWDNAYLLGNYNAGTTECEEDSETEEEVSENCNIPIELLSGDEFYTRCTTYIEGLKPSFTKPIAKEIGTGFEFLPQDLGSVTIEYIRYPKRAVLNTKMDEVYHEEVYDAATSVDLEWPPFAQDVLAWFIADMFFNYVSNQAGKTFNTMSGKTVRDQK